MVQMDDGSQIAGIAERFFFWLKAEIEFTPVIVPDDLMKAGPEIEAALKNYG